MRRVFLNCSSTRKRSEFATKFGLDQIHEWPRRNHGTNDGSEPDDPRRLSWWRQRPRSEHGSCAALVAGKGYDRNASSDYVSEDPRAIPPKQTSSITLAADKSKQSAAQQLISVTTPLIKSCSHLLSQKLHYSSKNLIYVCAQQRDHPQAKYKRDDGVGFGSNIASGCWPNLSFSLRIFEASREETIVRCPTFHAKKQYPQSISKLLNIVCAFLAKELAIFWIDPNPMAARSLI